MILILSDKSDQHADRVELILQKNAAEYSRLNLDLDSAKSTQVRIEDDSFRIEAPNCSFSTSQIEAVWNRSAHAEQLRENLSHDDSNYMLWRETWSKTLEGLFSSLESTKWLNLYDDFYKGNEFSQFLISKNIGLKWPSFICSNDINYLNIFFETKKERLLELMDQGCVNKPGELCFGKCSDRIGITSPNDLSDNTCPCKNTTYLVRCSVVGKEYFVGKIRAEINEEGKIIETKSNFFTEIHPPKLVKTKAIQIMNELNLTFGVFDFMVSDKGGWLFDALNPIGQYKWVEDFKDTDISSSIAKWLMMNN